MKQMKEGGAGQGPEGMGMPDVNSPEVQEQFAAMGMTPQDAIEKLMSDPELAVAFQNPKIQQAVMDCSSNPSNISKYQAGTSVSRSPLHPPLVKNLTLDPRYKYITPATSPTTCYD